MESHLFIKNNLQVCIFVTTSAFNILPQTCNVGLFSTHFGDISPGCWSILLASSSAHPESVVLLDLDTWAHLPSLPFPSDTPEPRRDAFT